MQKLPKTGELACTDGSLIKDYSIGDGGKKKKKEDKNTLILKLLAKF